MSIPTSEEFYIILFFIGCLELFFGLPFAIVGMGHDAESGGTTTEHSYYGSITYNSESRKKLPPTPWMCRLGACLLLTGAAFFIIGLRGMVKY